MSSEIRARLRRKRLEMSQAQIQSVSQAICARFLEASGLLEGLQSQRATGRPVRVALYRAVAGELDPVSLQDPLIAIGTRLCFPRVEDPDQKRMEMYEVVQPSEHAWQVGHYGALEPGPDTAAAWPEELSVIVTPGVAFGPVGERLGRGAGYYDRYLARAPQALRVALAFDQQFVDSLPQSEWDQQVDWVFTETRDLRRESVQAWLKSGRVERERARVIQS